MAYILNDSQPSYLTILIPSVRYFITHPSYSSKTFN